MAKDLFSTIRTHCRWAAKKARLVKIQPQQLQALADTLQTEGFPSTYHDPARQRFADESVTAAYVLTLATINFGSGWVTSLRKLPGMSGYETVATSLRQYFETAGPLSGAELVDMTVARCAALLGQDATGEIGKLCRMFTCALNDLGRLACARFQGRLEVLVASAQGSAERLLGVLGGMGFFRDEAFYRRKTIPFYKKGQLAVADLALALNHTGLGRFEDFDRLTVLADNMVPHCLRMHGVLKYRDELAAHIDAGKFVPAGSNEEIEIRASAVHAGELLVQALGARGAEVTAIALDAILWRRGHDAACQALPPHRTPTVFY